MDSRHGCTTGGCSQQPARLKAPSTTGPWIGNSSSRHGLCRLLPLPRSLPHTQAKPSRCRLLLCAVPPPGPPWLSAARLPSRQVHGCHRPDGGGWEVAGALHAAGAEQMLAPNSQRHCWRDRWSGNATRSPLGCWAELQRRLVGEGLMQRSYLQPSSVVAWHGLSAPSRLRAAHR